MTSILDRLSNARALDHWTRLADQAYGTDPVTLRLQRNQARQLRGHLDKLIHRADERLAQSGGSASLRTPHGTDWSWRPGLWSCPLDIRGLSSAPNKAKLGHAVSLFHDCPLSELTLRQIRNVADDDLAPFGVRLEVFKFGGSFLSLAVNMPRDAVDGLTKSHLIRVATSLELERPTPIFLRLNVQHGPNTEQLLRDLRVDGREQIAEFDLAFSGLNEKRIEHAWVDLIFEAPELNEITVRDLTFARLLRAEI